jgi:hypothetical protein
MPVHGADRVAATTVGTRDGAPGKVMLAIEPDDLEQLRKAHQTLEHPSLAARLSSLVGTPIEIALQLMPRPWYRRVHGAAETAVGKAYDAAVSSLRREHEISASERLYRGLAAGTGAVGGLFGLPGLVVELPVTTTLMLRSIAEIARFAGEDIHDPESRLACIQVFALGGRSESDDAAETGYYGVRLALSGYMSAAAAQVAQQGLSGEGVPAVVQLIRAIASRFGVEVSRRVATQVVPVVGAAGGAVVNTIFMQHFQDMARSHFTVRRLERKYGEALVRARYKGFDPAP